MADILPTDVFEGYAYLAATNPAPAAGLFIPTASLSGANVAAPELDDSTGDGRALIYALIQVGYAAIAALADNAKPTQMTIAKSQPAGIGIDAIRNTYTVTFNLDVSPSNNSLVSEP